jgi:hypothetical protein
VGLSLERCFRRVRSVRFSGRPAVTERDGEAFPSHVADKEALLIETEQAKAALTARWG